MLKKIAPTLLTSTILVSLSAPAAFAQTAAELFERGDACEALLALNTERVDELRPEWIEESRGIIEAEDTERCVVFYEEAVAALDNTGEIDATAAARIVVTQPDPVVEVDQVAPEVTVTNPAPQVRVNQGQPEIIVRQAPPTVRVEVPQPIITIDQPQPQIIVRMPEPEIAVTNPEPEVDVVLAEPQVTVEQPEAEVALVDQATSPTEATIDVDQSEPQVYLQEGQEPEVLVESGEPSIVFEAAEPNIVVEQVGEPEIRFNQSGEADVQFEQGAAVQGGAAVEGGAMAMGTQDAELYAVLLVEEEMEAGELMQYNASDLAGRNLTTVSGQALGSVDRVVDQGGIYYIVVTDGSAFGMPGEAGLPLENISVQEGELVFRGLTEEQLGTVTEFDPAGAQPLGATDRVEIGTL